MVPWRLCGVPICFVERTTGSNCSCSKVCTLSMKKFGQKLLQMRRSTNLEKASWLMVGLTFGSFADIIRSPSMYTNKINIFIAK